MLFAAADRAGGAVCQLPGDLPVDIFHVASAPGGAFPLRPVQRGVGQTARLALCPAVSLQLLQCPAGLLQSLAQAVIFPAQSGEIGVSLALVPAAEQQCLFF